MCGPHHCLGRGAFASGPEILRRLLQLRQNASILEQRCAGHSPNSANRKHQITRHPWRTSPPLRPSLSFRYTQVEDSDFSSIRPLIDWLDYNGFTVVTKPTKEFIDAIGRRKVKGNMDIELAVDALELAPHLDEMVLFSGDGDFRSLVEAVQRRGVHVTVVSTLSSQPPMIADELRRQADVFTDLVELKSKIGRDPSERPAPREPR